MVKRRTLVNPGKKKRKMSALQKMFFGSKRQRAAVANKGKRKRKNPAKGYRKFSVAKSSAYKKATRYLRKRRKKNISHIVVVKRNPARRKRNARKVVVINKGVKMATKRRVNRSYKRRRKNYGTKVGRSWSTYKSKRRNPSRRRRHASSNPGVRRYHRRSHNVARRRHYRRNPGILTGTMGRVLGVIGGLAVTKLLMGFVPASLSTGVLGYLTTGVVAVAQGKLVGKVAKSEATGQDFMVGGLAYLAAKILNDFLPSVGSYTGISGMGLIGGSSFYVPQVNQNGSMGSFVVPGAVMGAMPMAAPANAGVGRLRRTGRLM